LKAATYQEIMPSLALGLPFTPREIGANYLAWPKLPELFPEYFPGVITSRDEVLVSIDREPLFDRMTQYFDQTVSDDYMRSIAPRLMENINHLDAKQIRTSLVKRGFLPQNVVRYCYRPFDVRWLYWEPETKLITANRSKYFPHVQLGNVWMVSQQKARRDWTPSQIITQLGSLHLEERGASCIPLYLYKVQNPSAPRFDDAISPNQRDANLTDMARSYLGQLFSSAPSVAVDQQAEALFYHSLAIMHAPRYRAENAGALRQDWPRVPLPKTRQALEASAVLGRQAAALLDVETPVPGVTQGTPREDLRSIAILTEINGHTPDFTINVNWGHFGVGSAVMPGRGRLVKADGGAVDVYLNETTYWRSVPADVWEYTLGGYQVLKKWLSYRETAVLGRPLKPEEAREFTHIARRIAALLSLNGALDANYGLF
jgi:Type ISP C-terminal specificity domain